MPSKKKKYNARFPAGRIKKIMQTDEEVGKVAQAVPVIISRALELFIESLLTKSTQITLSRNAKTLTPSHMKQCILSESRFDFLKDLVKNIPDASIQEDNENNALFELNIDKTLDDSNSIEINSSPEARSPQPAHFHTEQSTSGTNASTSRTPVIQYGPKVTQDINKLNFSISRIINDGREQTSTSTSNSHQTTTKDCHKFQQTKDEPKLHITIASQQLPVPHLMPASSSSNTFVPPKVAPRDAVPPLVPLSRNNLYGQNNTGDNLCIDEDYDN